MGLRQVLDKMRGFLGSRAIAYKNIFSPSNRFAEVVLYDLAKFCRANESCFHTDPRLHAAMEGRREVWNRIQHHLRLPDEKLWELYGRKDLE